MEIRHASGYLYIGTAVRYLMDIDAEIQIHGTSSVSENISELERFLTEYEFHVTLRVASGLANLRDGWAAEATAHAADPEWASSRLVTEEERRTIVSTASIVRETLLAEGQGKVAFVASDKRYTVDMLINDISAVMGAGVFDGLPDIAKYDFKEGGQAIAFDLPTAAAFHILRGTEAALRDFYMRVVRRDRIREPRMWGPMVTHLRGKKNSPTDLMLNNLDSLRVNFRNPTQHPEKTYDSDEVQDLLALAIDSVNRMARHLSEKSL